MPSLSQGRDSRDLLAEQLKIAIGQAIDEEIAAAIPGIEQRVRERMGSMATKIAQWTDFEQLKDRLVITVRFPERDSKTPSLPGGYGG
jgi:hypothetical protein